ncbi:MAG: hypothetical protein TREMPRED_003586 [Tremellales sp. Tagirdzhanova-0007]|nr:MAG: hypothetical protein TREMPRED_003586 [Tremellales sp. Tagirdzhanova-0007]
MSQIPTQTTFKRNAHVNFFLRCLRALPTAAQDHDSNRITIAYFCISGLDLLGVLEEKTTLSQREGWAAWIWRLQAPTGGFQGSTSMTTKWAKNPTTSCADLPSTYTALLTLALLRTPLNQLDIPNLIAFIRSCQTPDGSFSPVPVEHEDGGFQSDLRMTYCASAIASIVQDFSGINVAAASAMIERCRTWEGGFASRPGVIEAQGGTTYCALASLSLLPLASTPSISNAATGLRWLLQRQIGGFQGRPGKSEDVCYSFWCGAAISIAGHSRLVDRDADRAFLLSAQSPIGGFGKDPEDHPDPYHSYLALAALALSHSEYGGLGLRELDPAWNVSVQTAEWLRSEMARVKRI